MRLIILIALIYLAYRVLKSWFLKNVPLQPHVGGADDRVIDDMMIQDPVCQVYFPKQDGVHLHVKGQDMYFCSEACRDEYLASNPEHS